MARSGGSSSGFNAWKLRQGARPRNRTQRGAGGAEAGALVAKKEVLRWR